VDSKHEALLKEYGEVSSNFGRLTDIRFRLLGLIPVATLIGAITEASKHDLSAADFVVSLFGLAVVLGLMTYSVRNDQLYDELIGRAADIERSLGIRDGSFGFRPRPWLRLPLGCCGWKMDHGRALIVIYGATAVVWLTGVLAPAIEFLQSVCSERFRWLTQMHMGLKSAEILVAFAVSVTVTVLIGFWGMAVRDARQKQMRRLAKCAFRRGKNHFRDPALAVADGKFIDWCIRLAGKKPGKGTRRRMRLRIKFHTSRENIGRYLPQSSAGQFSAHLIASLSDFPPRWIFDCASGRRA
jgi:hypothetical protein